MFKNNKTGTPPPAEGAAESAPVIKYLRPKVLLINVEKKAEDLLKSEGYNIAKGTFGRPYKVPIGSNYQPLIVNAFLPNFMEQEVIVIDLVPDEPTYGPEGDMSAPLEELNWWAKCSVGVIDPRPRTMHMVHKKFDRILETGGVFVVFSDTRNKQNLVLALMTEYRGLSIKQDIPCDNWSFLSILNKLTVTHDHGEEITHSRENNPLMRLLGEHLDDASFCCTFEAPLIEERWEVLAKNKYGAPVAAVITPPKKSKSGWILVLPRIKNKGMFLAGLLKNVLPELAPTLFPHAEGQRWVHRPEYELSTVLVKARDISAIQDDAAQKVAELEKAIEADRNANKFMYDLLRESGGSLVVAVQRALALLGFKSVVDVDEEMKKAGKDASLREDLRIHDNSPVLVVDIKGVAGKPADPEALQAQKHAFIYIQEQNRADVRGLTIINHQRVLPPLDRDNDMPFRKEILDNAEQVKLGLMTTWDLFRLVRGFVRYTWTPEQVMPIFYDTGRIQPVPRHYQYIGRVKQIWKVQKAFSVEIEEGEIKVGDRISVEFPVDFMEDTVKSLRQNNVDVEVGKAKCEVGIQTTEFLSNVKKGMAVYRIQVA